MTRKEKVIGVDASRCRSGGVIAYLLGILTGSDPREHGISKVHIWSNKSLMVSLPDYSWLIKHTPPALEKSIVHQLSWQYIKLPQALKKQACDILFNPDAGTICPFTPNVTISQDMLSYEPGEMQRFGFSKARIRLLLLKYIQTRALKKARGAIFATNYVKTMLVPLTGSLKKNKVIPHGIADEFRQSSVAVIQCPELKKTFRCLYVSNALLYKHQWHVIDAIGQVRKKGIDVSLLLVGGGEGRAQAMLDQQRLITDPAGEFIQQLNFVSHDKIPGYLSDADVFVFASSCENMPITLLEAMGAGLPIACSNRGPMPEILEDAGEYFDPEDPVSIAQAIEDIVTNSVLREKMAKRAKELSEQYSWGKSADETWAFIKDLV